MTAGVGGTARAGGRLGLTAAGVVAKGVKDLADLARSSIRYASKLRAINFMASSYGMFLCSAGKKGNAE